MRKSWIAVAVLCILAICSAVNTAEGLPDRVTHWDFSHYYLSAMSLRLGENAYTASFQVRASKLGLEAGDIDHATYPPTFLLLIAPLTYLPEAQAYWVWQTLNVILFAAALVVLLGPIRSRELTVAAVACAILYPPIAFHFYFGQSEIAILFLLAVMLRCLERGKDGAAGLLLALAILIKVFPAVLAGYLLIERRWRSLVWMSAGVAAGTGAALLVYGPPTVFSYAGSLSFITTKHWLSQPFNVSAYAVFSQWVWWFNGDHEGIRLAGGAVAAIVILSLAVQATLRSNARALPLWIVAMVLLSPTAWNHTMVLLLIVFAQFIDAGNADRRTIQLALVSWLLALPSSPPILLAPMDWLKRHLGDAAPGRLANFVGSMQFYSLFACFIAAWLFSRGGVARFEAPVRTPPRRLRPQHGPDRLNRR